MVLGEAKYCTVMNYKSCNEVKVSQQVAELIAGLPWKWYFECSVVCRDQQGKEYIVSETVHCESAYRQSDPRLNEFLNKHHKAFLAKQNNLHVITLAWVAVPAIGDKVDLEIETLDKIYTKLGAFDYLSTWENNKMEEAAGVRLKNFCYLRLDSTSITIAQALLLAMKRKKSSALLAN